MNRLIRSPAWPAPACSPPAWRRRNPAHRRQDLHRAAYPHRHHRAVPAEARLRRDGHHRPGSTLAAPPRKAANWMSSGEYTGSSLIVHNHIDQKLDAAASYRRVKQLDEAQGLVWLKPTRFNNTYALAMPERTGRAPGHPERQRSRAGARRTAGGRAREHPPVRHGPSSPAAPTASAP